MTERYAKAVAHLSEETAEKTAAAFGLFEAVDQPEKKKA